MVGADKLRLQIMYTQPYSLLVVNAIPTARVGALKGARCIYCDHLPREVGASHTVATHTEGFGEEPASKAAERSGTILAATVQVNTNNGKFNGLTTASQISNHLQVPTANGWGISQVILMSRKAHDNICKLRR